MHSLQIAKYTILIILSSLLLDERECNVIKNINNSFFLSNNLKKSNLSKAS